MTISARLTMTATPAAALMPTKTVIGGPAAWVDRLARAGLVCRRPDPDDLRRVLLAGTGKQYR
jgi:hypothetical protein